jgi:hypothetical protein
MRVLLTEATFDESVPVRTDLEVAGFDVYPCHRRSGVCQAFTSSCPLDLVDIDVAVVVRSGGRAELTAREFGAVCAHRAGVPVLVTSADELPPPVVPVGLVATGTAAVPRPELVQAVQRTRQPVMKEAS